MRCAVAENEIGVLCRGELRKSKNGENSECDANARREVQHAHPPRMAFVEACREENFGKQQHHVPGCAAA